MNIPVDDSGRQSEVARGRNSVNIVADDGGRHSEDARGRSSLHVSAAGSKRLGDKTLERSIVKSPTIKKRRPRSPEVIVVSDTNDLSEMEHETCRTRRDSYAVVSHVRFFCVCAIMSAAFFPLRFSF